MRYLFVAQTLSQGGAERVITVLSSALTKGGADVTVIKYFNTENEYEIDEKVKVINLLSSDTSTYRKKDKLIVINRLRKEIKKIKPDCIIPFTLPVAELTQIAVVGLNVNVFQSIRINPKVMPANRWKRIIRDWLVYRSKCTFVQNSQQKQYFKASHHDRIHVLYNPVSEGFFEVNPKIHSEKFTICALGRLTDQKNYPLMIDAFVEAFKDESSVELRIFGEGPQKEILKDYIDRYNMATRIKLMGRTSDVISVFQEADLYVLSSDWEGMPNALIEAMACQTFCISTDCPTGPSDLIQNGINGLLVPVGDKQALKEAFIYVFNLPYSEKKIISERARETIKRLCSSQSIAFKMNMICESVVMKRKKK